MAVTGFFHHIGTFLLLVSTILLIITTISSPVVNDIGILKVTLSNATSEHYSEVSFGTFGYCFLNTADDNRDYCSHHKVGYRPANIMTGIEDTSFSDYSRDVTHVLTKVMILHPIATGIAFIAFVLALGSGFFGSLLAAFTSLLAFVVTVVALICDFVLFSIIRDNVNHDGSGSHAAYSAGIWTILVAAVCSLLGAIIVFFTCCSARLHRRRDAAVTKNDYGTASRRRRWF
ncbi:pH-response regulator protein palI/prr-5 [Cytospora mali]|uniref:PH-response regulator protein palI/prr-5 n=1 Tax=Cytospora mali TaxID=578113 RepID=A0A194VBT4_CYTMA|nr:pH-response regulator protein palI/prr-5 [Valsa mali var. pyri (nom. inval.)]